MGHSDMLCLFKRHGDRPDRQRLYLATGKQIVNERGAYCVDLAWKTRQEHWCRVVYRYKDAFYLGAPNLGNSPNAKVGLLKVWPDASTIAFPRGATFDGRWTATFRGGTVLFQADVQIDGDRGTWYGYSHMVQKDDNQCLVKRMPLRVLTKTDTAITFEVLQGEVVPGCETWRIGLVWLDADTLAGQLAQGWNIRLTRK
ncbi:hypothetical protein [Variovorax sp. YR216]|uniref:hypothetical protein n=1 Tax=Variovorax sp. YR216 TaxID=1882828 RepID=UPI00089D8630|nr:hypothetical protein [Variovorax sp. YR216]SEB06167.1 hypothetical protein SAMN05444680_106218 [Variovorax sp. YR216]